MARTARRRPRPLGRALAIAFVLMLALPLAMWCGGHASGQPETIKGSLRGDADGAPPAQWAMVGGGPGHTCLSPYPSYTALHSLEWQVDLYANTWASPVLDSEGNIYFQDGSWLRSLDRNGVERWSKSLAYSLEHLILYEQAQSALILEGDVIVYPGLNDGLLGAIDKNTNVVWTIPYVQDVTPLPVADSITMFTPTASATGMIIIGAQTVRQTMFYPIISNFIMAAHPNGTWAWTFQTLGAVTSAPAVAQDGSIVAGDDQGSIYRLDASGGLLWQVLGQGGSVMFSPSVDEDGYAFVPNSLGWVTFFAPNGTQTLRFMTGNSMTPTPMVDSYGNVYVGGARSRVDIFDHDGGQTGTGGFWVDDMNSNREVWSLMMSEEPASALVLGMSDGALVFMLGDGFVLNLTGRLSPYLARAEDGTIVLTSSTGILYAVKEGPPPISELAPSAPMSLQAYASGQGFDLYWSLPTEEGNSSLVAFRVYRGVQQTGMSAYWYYLNPPEMELLAEVGPTTQHLRDYWGVSEDSYYTYCVTAVNADAEGPASLPTHISLPQASEQGVSSTVLLLFALLVLAVGVGAWALRRR